MSNTTHEWALKVFQGIEFEGKRIAGLSVNSDRSQPPKWFDRQLYEKALIISRRYYVGILWGQFIGLMLSLNFPKMLAPLNFTGHSATVSKLFRRYLSTGLYVKQWIECRDPFNPNSNAFKSLALVRQMHKRVAESMHNSGGSKSVWISQKDMVYNQFSFIGFVILFPQHCGLHLNRREMESLVHFWRVIGYCLGIDDRFNLCQGSLEQTQQLFLLMLNKSWLKAAKRQPSPGVEMAKGICLAMGMFNPFSNYNVVMTYWQPVLGLELTQQPCSRKERVMLWVTKNLVLRFRINLIFSSSLFRVVLFFTNLFKNQIEKMLMKKYGDLSCLADDSTVL